ncbi:16S rRNA A1518/A1519 N6-dimethyltransferase RsmA/KsgA/DIM1 with predicted DNA glycosylase/AP lyase activity [Flavobacterium sp. W4I14]|nr:16S rRNA A1518/A1519 N6-dimethyltransferase RsmA/KsgA/DIM1 with predicted DNA glycosylase/AP lyase activity [Flavobacterium sp. W4I14]
MPIKSYHKKLNFVKNLDKIERFVAVFAKEFVNQIDKKINTDRFSSLWLILQLYNQLQVKLPAC